MFADVDAMVVAFLDGIVTPDVAVLLPNPIPSEFVHARRVGGAAVHRALEQATVTVTAWGGERTSTVAAAALAGQCRDALLGQYTLMPLIRGVSEVTAPFFDPDPDTGRARYSFTHRLSVRAHF